MLIVAFVAGGCSEDTVTDVGNDHPDPEPETLALRIDRTNDFAFDLYHELRSTPDNLLVSPHSIAVAFAMAYAGARGGTEQEIAAVLNFPCPQAGFHSALCELNDILMSRGLYGGYQDFQLNIANGCWGAEYLHYEQAYLDTLTTYYGAGMRFLDFAGQPEASLDTINQWVADQTYDRIKNLLPDGSIDGATYLVLANTIYFRASWLEQFDPVYTFNGYFTLLDGTDVIVPIMVGEESFGYYEGDGYRAVELPYLGNEVSMIAICPDEGRYEAIEAGMDAAWVAAVADSLVRTHIVVNLPRFSFESAYDLIPTLKDMGMTEAFAPGADFSGMDGTDDGIPWIDVVAHKTFISVDEYGTEAAAGTGMVMTLGMHNTFAAVRPFIFAIIDKETGTILFLGRVLDPR
jgi:serpin B